MAEVTVQQFADQVGTPVDRLLQQFAEAGVAVDGADTVLSSEQKTALLTHLRQSHGENTQVEPRRVTLKRRSQSELKVSAGQGRAKTVNVEVRRKRTYVKRGAVLEQEKKRVEAVQREREAEEAKLRVEEEKRQAEIEARRREEEEKRQAEKVERERELRQREHEKEERAREAERRRAETEAKREEDEEQRRQQRAFQGHSHKPRGAEGGETLSGKLHVKPGGHGRRPGRGGRGRKRRAKVASVEMQHGFEKPVKPQKREVEIPEAISVSDLAQRMAVKAPELIRTLMGMGMMATINQMLDQDTAVLVVEELGHTPKLASAGDIEEKLLDTDIERGEAKPRAPVVTVMGHVDHGKTSLLDYIRRSQVTTGEAGGITQHIGAYHVERKDGGITFIDTPGHAAFTAMRARGAGATDIVILVVAADDGVMPQTIEAIEHARAAKVPIVVAVNKSDKPEADPDRVRNELAQREVVPEEWGGDVQFVNVSAKTGDGVEALLEAISLQAELLELAAAPDGPARGVVLEARLDKGRGPIATMLVQEGTLKRGSVLLAGQEFGRVRALLDENGQQMKSVGPAMPVQVLGLSGTPEAGDEARVVADERKAREVAEHRHTLERDVRLAGSKATQLEEMFSQLGQEGTQEFNLIIKADVQGSLEAIRDVVMRFSTDEVQVKVIGSGVGAINESDINLAAASGAVILGFNVRADSVARRAQQEAEVDIRYYSVIYELTDDVRQALSGMLSPELREQIVGLAQVREVFRSPKFGDIAGCLVEEGYVRRDNPIRVLRESVVIFEGQLESLRRFKDNVNEVRAGTECGIGVKDYDDVRAGDQIECYERIEVARTIEA